MKRVSNHFAALFAVLAVTFFSSSAALADLGADLQDLNSQADALHAHLEGTELTAEDICAPLNQANAMSRDMVDSIESIDGSLAAPLQTDAAVYDALDDLIATSLDIANEGLRLSVDLEALSGTAEMITIKDGIAAMLQLSADIGTMADRIGAMSDNILVMSDNIGLMADRILQTQQLQNQNVALTTDSILQTQTNMLTLVSVIEDASYELSFDGLIHDGNKLAAEMGALTFSPWRLHSQLEAVAADVRAFREDVQAVHDTVINDSTTNTIHVSYDALMQLGNLSLMLKAMGDAVDGYVIAITGMEPMTSTATLTDAMGSMLQLSGDIGVMSNRILEMADQILVMSDNIGMQADQILSTQAMMNTNVAVTQTSILEAQEMVIRIIEKREL